MPVPITPLPDGRAIIEKYWPGDHLAEESYIDLSEELYERSGVHEAAAEEFLAARSGVETHAAGLTAGALQARFTLSADQHSARATADFNRAANAAVSGQNLYNTRNMLNGLATDFQATWESLTAANMATGGTQPAISAAMASLKAQTESAAAMVGASFEAAHQTLKQGISQGSELLAAPSFMPPTVPTTGDFGGWGTVPGAPPQFAPMMGGGMGMGGFDGSPGSLIGTMLSNAPMIAQAAAEIGGPIGEQLGEAAAQAQESLAEFESKTKEQIGELLSGDMTPGEKLDSALERAGIPLGGATHPSTQGDDGFSLRDAEVGDAEPEGDEEQDDVRDLGSPPSTEAPDGVDTTPAEQTNYRDVEAETTPETDQAAPEPAPAAAPEPAPAAAPEPAPATQTGGGSPNVDPVAQSVPSGGGGESMDGPTTTLSGEFTADQSGVHAEVTTSLTSDSGGGGDVTTRTSGGAAAPTMAAAGGAAGAGAAGGMGMMPMGGMGAAGGAAAAATSSQTKRSESLRTGEATSEASVADQGRKVTDIDPDPEADAALAHYSDATVRGIRVLGALSRAEAGTEGEGPLAVAVYEDGRAIYSTADALGFPRRGRTDMVADTIPLSAVEGMHQQFRADWSGGTDPASVLALAAQVGFIGQPEVIVALDRDPTLPLPGGVEVVSSETVGRATPAPLVEGALIAALPKADDADVEPMVEALSAQWHVPLGQATERDGYMGMVARRWDDTTHAEIHAASVVWLLLAAHEALAAGDRDYAAAAARQVVEFPRPGQE